ncbi:hypothetical protein DAI22_04g200432 [Oryza sativa Japonica Group]|nr:hypothetical protein DAI22_04g200432 [Oryza sativa Japonica Group]
MPLGNSSRVKYNATMRACSREPFGNATAKMQQMPACTRKPIPVESVRALTARPQLCKPSSIVPAECGSRLALRPSMRMRSRSPGSTPRDPRNLSRLLLGQASVPLVQSQW